MNPTIVHAVFAIAFRVIGRRLIFAKLTNSERTVISRHDKVILVIYVFMEMLLNRDPKKCALIFAHSLCVRSVRTGRIYKHIDPNPTDLTVR